MQAGDWVCKHCHRLLLTADRVISREAEGFNCKLGESSEAAHDVTAAEQVFLLVKPQRWMGDGLAAAREPAGSSLHCPK